MAFFFISLYMKGKNCVCDVGCGEHYFRYYLRYVGPNSCSSQTVLSE